MRPIFLGGIAFRFDHTKKYGRWGSNENYFLSIF